MKKLLPIVFLIACSSAAHAAPIYTYSTTDISGVLLSTNPAGGVNPNAGEILSLDTSYDAGNQIFTWEYTAGPGQNGAVNDGFWLVVSDGPNPKGGLEEYAILYGDLAAERVTAYVYNGQNNGSSNQQSTNFLGSFQTGITSSQVAGVTSFSMSINTSGINGHSASLDWDGVAFGNEIGIWFHPTANTTFTYGINDDKLDGFSAGKAGWYDTNAALPTTVPEPASIALLSIGAFAGFGVFRRRRGSKKSNFSS